MLWNLPALRPQGPDLVHPFSSEAGTNLMSGRMCFHVQHLEERSASHVARKGNNDCGYMHACYRATIHFISGFGERLRHTPILRIASAGYSVGLLGRALLFWRPSQTLQSASGQGSRPCEVICSVSLNICDADRV